MFRSFFALSSGKILFGLLIFKLCLAVITIQFPWGAVTADSEEYLAIARSIRETGRYQSAESANIDLVRPPGYPAFLAILLPDNDTSSYARVTIVQLALTGITTLLIYAIAYKLGNPKAGMYGAWIHALSPNVVLWSLTLMSEALFTMLLVLALLLTLIFIQESSFWSLFCSGIVLGLATLTRQIGLFLILIEFLGLSPQFVDRIRGIKLNVKRKQPPVKRGALVIQPSRRTKGHGRAIV